MITATTIRTGAPSRLIKVCLLIASGLLLNTPAVGAADNEMSQEYLTCIDKSNGVTRTYLKIA